MTTRQEKLLYKLLEKREQNSDFDNPYDILIHSVLNTICYKDLVNDFLNDKYLEIRKSILSNLEKRVKSCNDPENIYENLKQQLEENVGYHNFQRIRKVLDLLLSVLGDNYKIDYFNTFFSSRYLNDKKSAVKYIEYIKEDIHKSLLETYLETKNIVFLKPLLQKKYSEILASNIRGVWDAALTFYIKKQLIELIAIKHLSKLEFLKNQEYDLYLLSLIISKKVNSQDVIKELNKIERDKWHFAIYNISKEFSFNAIEKEIEKYIN